MELGIHLVQARNEDLDKNRLPKVDHLDPINNHISFQCEDMDAMEQRLKEKNIECMRRTAEEGDGRIKIEQPFFNNPDGFMIEICNCENLKLVHVSLGKIQLPIDRRVPPVELNDDGGDDVNHGGDGGCEQNT